MDFTIRNAINWNRNQSRRARRLAENAKSPQQRIDHERNAARFDGNVMRLLEAHAAAA